jgi:predicted nucleic acid-binding protein
MLLDTSGLLALLDAREPLHDLAQVEYRRATQRVNHGFVLAELVALGNARGVAPGVVLQFLIRLLVNPKVAVIWPSEALTSQAIALLTARQGRGYSLCDAVSFVVMRAAGVTEALTTDQHFQDEGFTRLLM